MSNFTSIELMTRETFCSIPDIYAASFNDKPWNHDWFEIHQFNYESNWVAYNRHELVGFIISFLSKGIPYISVLAVHPKYHNLGIGKQLVTHAISYWTRLDYDRVRIHVAFEREKALNLYRSIGFEIVSSDEDSFELLLCTKESENEPIK